MTTKSSLPKNFFLFVLLAFILWMLAKFSKEYEATVMFQVSYTSLPSNKVLQNNPEKEIPIHIRGSGFKLLSAKLFSKEIQLNTSNLINLKDTKYYILLNQQELSIEKQMASGLSIDYFIKDSIFFDLGYLATKKVPVLTNVEINFLPGYDFINKMISKPDSVVISGPDGILDTIFHVKTSKIVLNEVNTTINETATLKLPNPVVKLVNTDNRVVLNAEVDKFTEGVIEVPFIIDNLPANLSINTFPKTIKVSYKVGLSNFNKVAGNAFIVRCDYAFSQKNNLSYLIPKIDKQSDLVKNIKIIPNKIDFLIQK
ncbi:MAG: YbbR-like domain-containing protein [Flavobacteriaceae bacterium]